MSIVLVTVFVPCALAASEDAAGTQPPTFTLSESVDLNRHSKKGTALITVRNTSVATGSLFDVDVRFTSTASSGLSA
jgi:hypothetical protein